MQENHEVPPAALPRWVQISAGILLLAWAGLALVGSATIVIAPPGQSPQLSRVLGVVLVAGSLWGVLAAGRLVVGRERPGGGLLTPRALRVTGVAVGAILVVGIARGAFWSAGGLNWIRIVQAVVYLVAMLALFRLASLRSAAAKKQADDGSVADA